VTDGLERGVGSSQQRLGVQHEFFRSIHGGRARANGGDSM